MTPLWAKLVYLGLVLAFVYVASGLWNGGMGW